MTQDEKSVIETVIHDRREIGFFIRNDGLCNIYLVRHRSRDVMDFLKDRIRKFTWLTYEEVNHERTLDVLRLAKLVYELKSDVKGHPDIVRMTNLSYEDLILFEEMPNNWSFKKLKEDIKAIKNSIRKSPWMDPVQSDLFCKELEVVMEL